MMAISNRDLFEGNVYQPQNLLSISNIFEELEW